MARRIVRGEILIPEDAPAGRAESVVVRVLDVSLADAPSRIAGQQVLRDVRLPVEGGLPFSVTAEVDEQASYTVWVHVDLNGNGEIEVGDLISTQSHPVLTRNNPDRVRVPVRRVG